VEALCATARWCYARGWVPATSGNFSVRSDAHILITPTGLDRGKLTPDDLLEIDLQGRAHGVLLSRHGLYTWGQSVAEARRHLEALEFLFEVEGRRLLGGQA